MRIMKNIGFLMGILWKKQRGYFWMVAVSFLLPCVANLVQVMFPREILAALEEMELTGAGILAVSMCLLIFLTGAAASMAEYGKYSHNGELNITLNKMLAKSVSSWPYEKFEEFSSRQRYHFAAMCVKEGAADTVMGCAAAIGGNLLSLISLLYVSRIVTWWLWGIMALSVLVNIGCEIYRANYNYKSYEEYSAIDMCMLYARDAFTWKEFAKESRLFSMYHYVTDTANHYINLLAGLQVKRGRRTFAVHLVSCLFDFIQRIGVFGYIAWQTYQGNISIADFSMLTLALITISALCIDVAKNLVRIGETGKYIGAYADVIREEREAKDRVGMSIKEAAAETETADRVERFVKAPATEMEIADKAERFVKEEAAAETETADKEEKTAKRETATRPEELLKNGEGKLTVVFDHVSFAYPGTDTPALQDISFIFESDRKYGLVGANGSGKTTFINLLTGMYTPISGAISCNGIPLKNISAEIWRKLFSAVLQDFNIYAYTAEENVTMFRKPIPLENMPRESVLQENISQEFRLPENLAQEFMLQENKSPEAMLRGNISQESIFQDSRPDISIQEAMERAGIGWLNREEYLTSEYEQGRELSGGEAQKLAIARAIYRNAEIFVFDEPTAALSPVSERELYESVNREMKDKMVFFISHRLASCRMCDEILVFDKGRIAENGGHEKLMEKGGLYAEMFRAQASLYGKDKTGYE